MELIHVSLKTLHRKRAVGQHPWRDHAEGRPALRAEVTPDFCLFISRAIRVTRVRAVHMEFSSAFAEQAIFRSAGTIHPLQGFLMNLHAGDSTPGLPLGASAAPPGSTPGFIAYGSKPCVPPGGAAQDNRDPNDSREINPEFNLKIKAPDYP